MRSLVALALAALLSPVAVAADSELDQLSQWMTGAFSSEAQSLEDPYFRHIVLHMSPR